MTDQFPDGLKEPDDSDLEVFAEMQASAVNLPTVYQEGEMPIIAWDDSFSEFIDRRGDEIEIMQAEKTRCLFPWRVLLYLPETLLGQYDTLYFSQGSRPSCCGHADDFAYRSGLLASIGLGANLQYETTNPYPLWWLSKNKSERGGQSLYKMSKFANETGHFVMSDVGTDNTVVARGFEESFSKLSANAKKHQSAIVSLTEETAAGLAGQMFAVCRAGFGVVVGNSTAVNGSTVDGNNVEIATLGGRWAHATSFNAWMKRNGTEYLYWTNSHGKRYNKSTFGEPFDGCWMTPQLVEKFLSTSSNYGKPYAVLPESTWIESKGIMFDFDIPFPEGF